MIDMRRFKKTKAQLSMEYMTIMGFVILITIPLTLIYYHYSNTTADEISMNQLMQITRKIADSADSVYYLGKPSETTIKVFMPHGVQSVNITHNEISFTIMTVSGLSDIVASTNVNVSGTIPISRGIHFINLKAEDYYVNISGS